MVMEKREAKQFAQYVGELRKKKHLSMKQICKGLCSDRAAWYIEQGERTPGRLLREAILERLGVGAEDYECYLGYIEYTQWKMQHAILHRITFEDMENAEQLLDVYWNTYCQEEGHSRERYLSEEMGAGLNNSRLERQFYLSMLVQIRCYQEKRRFHDSCESHGNNICLESLREEIRALLTAAISLTISALEEKKISELVLSIKEINLILEAEHYRVERERPERYREILEYIESGRIDRRGKAKIYPKAVFFLCRCLLDGDIAEEANPEKMIFMLLKYCNRAVKILQDCGRMYFLWEILDMRERLLSRLKEFSNGHLGNTAVFNHFRQENIQWKQVLETVYEEFSVPKETLNYCYLYVAKGISCINDVIRIRSEMLDIKGEELCEGVCSIKTLRRVKKRTTVPQREIVEALFAKLGLSGELVKTELVTGIPKARELMEKLREHSNENQWEEVDELLAQIKPLVSMDIACNQQTIMRKEVMLYWKKGMIDKSEYCVRMREVLEITLPYEAFLKPGEKYLTREELSCIQNLMQGMDKADKEFLICMQRLEDIYQPFTETGAIETVSGMYEFIMKFLGSNMGNMGKFDKADKYDFIIIEGCLRTRRLWSIHDCLYDRWWNFAERKKKGIPTDIDLNDEEELNKCILLGQLAQSNATLFFRKN